MPEAIREKAFDRAQASAQKIPPASRARSAEKSAHVVRPRPSFEQEVPCRQGRRAL